MARKPKVYTAEIDGLHEWIVAAPNQADALAAFGVNQNLFAQGLAKTTDDPVAVEAAAKSPGAPLRRLKGTKDSFKPAGEGGVDAWAKAAQAAGAKPRKTRGKPKPDRSALARAEAELARYERQVKAEREDIAREADDLEQRRKAQEREQEARLRDLRRQLEAEQRRFASQG